MENCVLGIFICMGLIIGLMSFCHIVHAEKGQDGSR